MKFGLFVLPSWPEGEANHESRILGETLEQIEFAEELSFDSVWLAEHHFSRYGICPSIIPLATHVAARTRKIRIGTGVSVPTFHNPIFLAEETAVDGRFEQRPAGLRRGHGAAAVRICRAKCGL